MKYVHLVKQHSAPLLAHLYEHMYVDALHRLFKERGLFMYIDYSTDAMTYNDAIIDFNITLYTDRAMWLEPQLTKIDVTFDKASIDMAKAQIVAEKGLRPGKWDIKTLTSRLEALHAQPWLTLDEFGYYDTYKTRRDLMLPEFFVEPKPKTKILKTILVLDEHARKERHMLPLAHVLYTFLTINLHEILSADYGYYTTSRRSFFKNGRAEQIGMCRAWTQQIAHLSGELDAYRAFIQQALDAGIVEKLADYLQHINASLSENYPDSVEIYDDTGIFVGALSWREIGTKENLRKVLQHTTLQLVFGREKQSIEMAKLLEHKSDRTLKPTFFNNKNMA